MRKIDIREALIEDLLGYDAEIGKVENRTLTEVLTVVDRQLRRYGFEVVRIAGRDDSWYITKKREDDFLI